MSKIISAECHSPVKTILACLIISLMILGPLAPLTTAAPVRAKSTKTDPALPSPDPAAPFVPAITATKTDSFADLDGDGKAAPGETITYDVNITNNGTDATGVNFTDTIDSNTTLVGGSLKVSPLAFADTYSAAKNTPLSVGAPGVLTNDTGIPSPTAVAIAGGATAQGGTVTLNTDGSFLYTPATGFTGSDSFNYTVTNGLTPNDTAQVSINVDAPPSVTATTPTNGASNQPVNTDLTVTFSEPVNVTGNWFQIVCTSSGTRNVADTVVTGGPTTFTINPNVDFSQNETCTVTVFAAQVSDQDAIDPPDNMVSDFVFSFTSADAAPNVASTTPTNGATQQLTNTNIDVTFSEPVNVTGNWFQIVCTTSGTRNVADTVVSGGPTTFTINPNSDFAAGETCTVTVFAAQVTDQDSADPPDNMAANFVFSFTMEAAPTVNSTTPTNGATQVASNTNLSITFSEPVDVTGNWFQIVGSSSGTRNVVDTVVTGGPTTFTINPNVDFAAGETVTVTVFAAQVTDQDTNDPPDNMTANFVFSFTIDQAPSVTATTPTNGATNVAINSNLSVTFSEPVNVTGNWFQIVCPTSGTRNVADTVVTGGPTTFTINPNVDFAFNENCTVTVFAGQVSDQDSADPPDNMTANFVFSYTTVDAAPTVTATTPTNGAANQATNTNIDVTFSEPVNVTGNWFQIVCPTSGTRNPAATVVTGGPTTFTINPNVDFAPGETCTVTIFAAQVTDQDSNDPPDNMAANFVFSFTMDQAPSVTATTPTNGATQQASNTDITITFSEPVDVTGNWFQIVGASSGTRNVSDTIVTGGPTTFTINPNVDFASGELVTVTVFAAQVSDQDSADPPDNMVANFVFSFTIDQAPSVTTTIPTNNATDVALNSTITINFSESVNVAAAGVVINCGGAVGFTPALPQNNLTSLVLTPTGGLPPGSNCTVTVDKTKISDTDTADPPDNMINDFVFSFKVKPDAINDTYPVTLVGNVSTNSFLIPFSVTANDISANAVTITAVQANNTVVANTITTTSVNGGNIVMTVSGTDMGKFTYDPPAGFEGTDTFSYTISRVDGGGTDTAIVSIPISGMVWFINSSAASCTSAGCGRLSNPFSTLASFNTLNNGTGNNPAANDNIFIYTGVGNYTGPLTLLNNQKVIGQGATSTVASITGLTPPTGSPSFPATGGSKPSITTVVTSGNNGINLASGNQLFGLAFSNTDGAAIRGTVNIGTASMDGIVINNTGGGGVILTGGGTITITGTNTIVTTTATALNVSNTNIGAGNITFQSISSSGGSATGIILDTTGSAGGLNVTGDGANTTVGGNATGGTIANKSGADNSTTTGIGIYLNNTSNVVLRRMTINGTNQNFGIRGNSVNNFTLEYSTVNGTNGTSAALAPPEGAGEGSVYFGNTTTTGMTGTGVITNCIISGGRSRNFSLINSSGTLNRLTVTGTTFGLNQNFVDAQRSFSVEGRPSAAGTVLNTTVTGSTFTGSPGDVVNFTGQEPSTTTSVLMDVIFQNNAVSNSHAFNNIGGFGMKLADFSGMTFNVSNNSFRDANGSTLTLQMATPVAGSTIATNLSGTINNNTIGVAGVADSGSKTGNGIFLSLGDNTTAPKGQATFAITNNTIRNWHGNFGISADNTGGNYNLNATITGNTVLNPSATSFSGLGLSAGAPSSADDIDVCAAITGNDFSASSPAGVNIDVLIGVSGSASSIRLPGYSGSNLNQVQTFVQNNQLNAGTTAVSAFDDNGNGNTAPSFIGGAACTSPSTMVLPFKSTGRDMFAMKPETNRSIQHPALPRSKIVNNTVTPQTAAVVKTAVPTVDRQVNAIAQKTLSHHRTITKGDSVTRTSNATIGASGIKTSLVKVATAKRVNAMQEKKPGRIVVKPTIVPLAGETLTQPVGTLIAGKTVHIQFKVTVNNPYFGGATVSNQGTVSGTNFADVLTDDPAAGGANDPTTTPILLNPNISISDAQANEPSSGSTPMLFTVSLSAPAPAGGTSVHYQTADQAPALNHATAGTDYTAVPDTVLNFAAGEQFKTITVNVLADGPGVESDETFLVNLSNPTNGVIVDGQAVGTIKQGNAAGTFLISELRTSGPAGAGDDFVELYNNSDVPLVVTASDASGGYGLFTMGADCNATPVLIGTIPNGTTIPARGHYLFVGSAYSLADYGGTGAAAGNQTLTADIQSDGNVGIFNTASIANLSTVTRLDAVGFGTNTGGTCDLLREGNTLAPLSGSTLQYSYVRDECGKKGNPATFGPCPTGGLVGDTNVNVDDFIFVDTAATSTVAGQRLGAPGPQNLASPINRNSTILALLLDSNIGAPTPPNRVRDLTPVTNGANGTLSVRRRFVNNTGAPVTRLRIRVVDISTTFVPGGIADIRALTSTNVVVSGITDNGTCTAAGQSTPCTITVQGTTLETPPAQAMGGGHNSTMSAGTITLGTPLAPGASVNLQFLLGVQQTGSFKFFFNIEALP